MFQSKIDTAKSKNLCIVGAIESFGYFLEMLAILRAVLAFFFAKTFIYLTLYGSKINLLLHFASTLGLIQSRNDLSRMTKYQFSAIRYQLFRR